MINTSIPLLLPTFYRDKSTIHSIFVALILAAKYPITTWQTY